MFLVRKKNKKKKKNNGKKKKLNKAILLAKIKLNSIKKCLNL